jgi:hypothetical protein
MTVPLGGLASSPDERSEIRDKHLSPQARSRISLRSSGLRLLMSPKSVEEGGAGGDM